MTATLQQQRRVSTARAVYQSVQTMGLCADELAVVQQPDIVLWGPIWHLQQGMLGIMLVGMDPTLEPYHTDDVDAIQQVLDAAALAFANSAAYAAQCRSEQMIRQLYDEVQQAQDETAAAIAREVHDELLNITVRENIYGA
ncbi:MAG: hypothetical protein HC828_07285 [Blastochloris sp.]|nr:hypothetical protein [Blastochloris sp.]